MDSGKYSGFISGYSVKLNRKIAASAKTRRGSRAPALRLAALAGAVLAIAPLRTGLAVDVNSTYTDTDGNRDWSDANNWSPADVPNNGNGGNNYIVDLPTAPGAVTLNINATIDGLTVATSSALDILDNESLTLSSAATSVTDNGTIVINSNQVTAASILLFDGNTSLGGSGTIQLNYSNTYAQVNTGTGDLLTQGASHSIVGEGELNAALTNNGTVNANVSGQTLTLGTNAMTNNLTFEATGGGILAVNGVTVTQGSSGQISAATGSTVVLEGGATISDGSLSSAGTGSFQVSGTDTIGSVSSNATIDIPDNTTLDVTGNLANAGEILVNSNTVTAAAILDFNGGTVSGSGSIVLNYDSSYAQLNGTLTQGASHSIVGYGQINAALTNEGTVNANVSGQTLLLQTSNMTNNLTFEATGGGTLAINGITVNQGSSGQLSAGATSEVLLENGTTISDGSLSSTGSGSFQVSGTDTIGSVSSNATIDIPDNTTLDVTGNLANAGEILVNSNTVSAAAILDFNGGTVSGSGSIVLNYDSTYAQLNGTLTQALGHTISGYGEINAILTNKGTVNTNVSTQTLIVQSSSITNTGTMEATNGGTLEFTNAVSVNNTGGQFTANGGTVELEDGAAVSGGTITAVHPSVILVPANTNNGTLGYAASLSSLTLSTGTEVDVQDNATLVSSGSTLTDNGTIVINSNQITAESILLFNGNTSLGGSGTIELNDLNQYAQLNTGTGDVLTQGASHSIVGYGEINAALTNDGTVNADVSSNLLTLQTNAMTNDLTFEATGGGTLAVNGITVTQGSVGQVSAATGSEVLLESGATISDGSLSSAGTGSFQVSGTDTIGSVSSNATIDIPDGNTLNVTGNLTNTGEILVNSNTVTAEAVLDFSGGTVSGSGSIVLSELSIYAQLNGTLTQGSNHTISGFGEINAALTNDGTVNADLSGQTLLLQTNAMTNNLTFEATGGGTLAVNGITVTQGSVGQVSAATGSEVLLENGATISDGSLSSAGTGSFQVSGTDTIGSVSSNATIDIPDGNTLNVTGNLTNTGEIVVNSNTLTAEAILDFSGSTVSGSGSIVLSELSIYAQLNGTLTQGSNHTISGYGEINAALTNDGTVNADVSGQTLLLQTNAMTNNLTFEATGGGTLAVNGITVTQDSSGLVSAATDSDVLLENGATISDGSLSSAGTGSFQVSGTDTIGSVSSNATIDIPDGNTLNVTGNLTNTGEILVNSNTLTAAAILDFSGGTVSGNGSIVLNELSIYAQLNGTLTQGSSHTISGFGEINAAVTNDGTISADVSGQTLLLNHSVSGTGTLKVASGATLVLATGTGGSTQGSLSIAANGALNLTNNHLILSDPGGSIDATIRGYLINGYSSGAWDGTSVSGGTIITSAPTSIGSYTYSIGYADGANGVVAGLPSGQLEIAYTLAGDANLDGKVNSVDLGILAANFGASGDVWDQGDFNYDGKVNSVDLGLLALNFGQSTGGNADVVTAADWAALDAFAAANGVTIAEVPEPMTMGLLTLGAAGALARRRRR